MSRTHQFSQNLDLFYCCFETISPTLRFYIRLLISLTIARYEIILVWEVKCHNVSKHPSEPIKRILVAHQTESYSLFWMYM